MLVIRRMAASASSTSFQGTQPAHPMPAKIAASDARSSRVSSRRPASEARPYTRAIPPSIPSSTWPKAVRPRPHPRRPTANATPAAALAPKAAHVTWAGESPSVTWQSRSTGRIARSRARPTAGAKSYMTSIPEEECVPHEQRGEHHTLLHLVGDRRKPSPGDPGRVGIERHLFEAHAVVHRHVDREEDDRHDGAEKQAQRHDPQQRDRLLERGAPVVAALVPQPDVLQVERRLHGVIHVNAHPEGAGEQQVAALEIHRQGRDRKSTRLNSSHGYISSA